MSKSVRLVLGSGGARGLAHIGAIREIENRGYEIKSVIGCSVGAMVGACYCAGKLDKFAEWVCSLSEWDVVRFLDFSLTSKNGIMKGDMLTDTLRELVGDRTIEDLPLPFAAVATDINEHKEVWITRGDLFDAMRASMAIPGLMTPKEIDSKTLVDGGLLNPVPVGPTLRTLTDLTVVVDVNGPVTDLERGDGHDDETADDESGLLHRVVEYVESLGEKATEAAQEIALSEVLMRSLETMQTALTRHHLAVFQPDVVISIPKNVCMFHEFHRAETIIETGRKIAAERLDTLPPNRGQTPR